MLCVRGKLPYKIRIMNRSSYYDSQYNSMQGEYDVISITESTQNYSLDTVKRRDKRKTLSFKRKSTTSSSRVSVASEISDPVDVQRRIHVYHNSETGALEGLPLSWVRAIESGYQDDQGVKCLYEVYPIDKTFHERMRIKNEQLKKHSISTYQKLKNWFRKKSQPEVLSFPTDFHHPVHVTRNPATGELEGLPQEWLKAMAE